MKAYLIRGLMIFALIIAVAGCSSYYRVTDPASGKTYYTKKVNEAGKAGAVKIKDEKTGSTVTLQSSEVKEISEDEYEAGLKAAAPAPTVGTATIVAQPISDATLSTGRPVDTKPPDPSATAQTPTAPADNAAAPANNSAASSKQDPDKPTPPKKKKRGSLLRKLNPF